MTGSLPLVGAVSSVDAFQRRHPVLGFPLAVIYKYFDDQGPYLASALTYYAFVAIFPLMLLGTSILGIILRGEPNWQQSILDSALAQFPIIGDELGRPEGLQGSFAGVAVGALAALYGAMGLGQALQNTQHVAWSVPRNSRPEPVLRPPQDPRPPRHRRLLAAGRVDRRDRRQHDRPLQRGARPGPPGLPPAPHRPRRRHLPQPSSSATPRPASTRSAARRPAATRWP